MNELLIWILAIAFAAVVMSLVSLRHRRRQRAREAAERIALEQAEHVARARQLAADRAETPVEPDTADERRRAEAEQELAEATRRIAEAEAARLAREQAENEAAIAEAYRLAAEMQAREKEEAERAEREQAEREAAEAARLAAEAQARDDAERLAREQAEREAAAAEAARRAEEAEAARVAAEARAREEAERLARETVEREAAQREAARLAQEAEDARLAAEAQAREDAARLAREQASREAAEAAETAARAAAEAEAARLAAEAQARAEAAAAAVATRELRADETLVLVADDSKIVRVKLSRLLATRSYRVALAESGEQALELLAAERPHVLITDVEMPGIDGFELTRQVRAAAATSQLPVLMITSSDDKQEQAQAAGVTQLLGKPFSEEALLTAIEQARLAVRVPA
ncbi:response regulator [Roseateles sp. DC23W]|uniref:Response regulator n=1 Tax=Pelomonas dachongensis TaxID=3299029 RepID=A0ABW7ELZ2_9BURK